MQELGLPFRVSRVDEASDWASRNEMAPRQHPVDFFKSYFCFVSQLYIEVFFKLLPLEVVDHVRN